jgi:hypothetical protein
LAAPDAKNLVCGDAVWLVVANAVTLQGSLALAAHAPALLAGMRLKGLALSKWMCSIL